MNVLFCMSHPGHARNFEWTLRELASRGHSVTVLLERAGKTAAVARPLDAVAADHRNVRVELAPERERFSRVGIALRTALDYLRYADDPYADVEAARSRAAQRTPASIRRVVDARVFSSRLGRRALRSVIRLAEEGVPTSPRLRSVVERLEPDVVLVTPLVELGSPQTEYLRCAAALGIPSALLVASWDNLTMKGGIHLAPDLVAVWNDAQRQEASELHGVPPERVAVVGAVAWDHWFDGVTAGERGEFCARLGLDAEEPYVLYVCSSGFLAPGEGRFLLEWLRDLRDGADAPQVLIRPHPTKPPAEEERAALQALGNVVIHPPAGEIPDTEASRQEYFDALVHSGVVVGVNTSALIEATIVDRPALAVAPARYRATQWGTLHFRYLLREAGGPVDTAADAAEHREQVRRALGEPNAGADARRAFVESFIRPHGLSVAATPRLADVIEELGRLPARAPARSSRLRSLSARTLALATRAAAAVLPDPAESAP
jgi:hypothetical protein